jgi:Flp pilus assembly protein TadD
LLNIADAKLQINKLVDASNYYKKVLIIEPGNLHATEGQGLIYFKRHDYERAKPLFTEVLEKDHTRWRAWNARGVIADMQGKHDIARQHFRKALDVDKTNVKVINNLGYSLMMSHQYAAAEKVFREGLEYEPGFFRLRNNLAISLAWQKRYDEAVRVLVKVVKYEIAYNNIGYIAMLNEQYTVARKYFKKAISISPTYYVRAARNLEKVENLMNLKDNLQQLKK